MAWTLAASSARCALSVPYPLLVLIILYVLIDVVHLIILVVVVVVQLFLFRTLCLMSGGGKAESQLFTELHFCPTSVGFRSFLSRIVKEEMLFFPLRTCGNYSERSQLDDDGILSELRLRDFLSLLVRLHS